jgi:hypothetical protein
LRNFPLSKFINLVRSIFCCIKFSLHLFRQYNQSERTSNCNHGARRYRKLFFQLRHSGASRLLLASSFGPRAVASYVSPAQLSRDPSWISEYYFIFITLQALRNFEMSNSIQMMTIIRQIPALTSSFEAMQNPWNLLKSTKKAAGRTSCAQNVSRPLTVPVAVLTKPNSSLSRAERIRRSRVTGNGGIDSARSITSSRRSSRSIDDVRVVAQPDVPSFSRIMNY